MDISFNKWASLLALVLVGAWFNVCAADRVETLRAGLMSEFYCNWGVSQSAFNASVASNMAELALINTEDSRAARAAWLDTLLSLHVSTNDYRHYRLWMNEKVQWTSGCARRFLEPANTNIWAKTADLLHVIRQDSVGHGELLQRVAADNLLEHVQATGNGLVVVSSGMPDWYWREVDHLAHCQQFAEVVRMVVVDQYGSRGIPRLPADVRWSFYSNFVERAGLDEGDRAKIRNAIDRVDKKED